MYEAIGYQKILDWFHTQGWQAMEFQETVWQSYLEGKSGLINAPTGSGKTYSILLGVLIDYLNKNRELTPIKHKKELQLIWITPIKALAKEIQISCCRALENLGIPWSVEMRTGDSTTKTRQNQLIHPPEILITTPESLHVLMATKNYASFLQSTKTLVVDEWHELVGSKRGVQTELVISRLVALNKNLRIWGISATISNLEEAMDVLLYPIENDQRCIVKAGFEKEITIESVIPPEIETYPWAGHLGIKLIDRVVAIIREASTSLIFTNTRAQCEIWYQKLLETEPDLAGQIAMHHGSISKEIRDWVEEALYEGKIKAVVCTSSLDLGVDFRPVSTVVQIGSPKGVARFIQRAGRSGHSPNAQSKIWFVPTHALELLEAAGLRMAIQQQKIEARIPYLRSFDVLIQYLMTLAVSDGFYSETMYKEIKKTYCFASMDPHEWQRVIHFLLHGNESLKAYDEYKKVVLLEDGKYIVVDKKKALRHRLSIGTIVSDAMISVQLLKGGRLGSIEEWFISQLNPNDVFWFAGKALELVRIKDMTAQVRYSTAKNGKVPAYSGGRMPLSSQLSFVLREKMYSYTEKTITDIEVASLIPLLEMQAKKSAIPNRDELLIEYFESKEGHHLIFYPFEGRNVHEGMASLIAKRLSIKLPITFSIAMNDLGFELLSDQKIDIYQWVNKELFSTNQLTSDILASVNSVELAKRRFRDIAKISGLLFSGYPGKHKKDRHLQASSQLIFEVFKEYEPEHLLYQQCFDEVLTFQLEELRLRSALQKIRNHELKICMIDQPSPFSFPIIVDRMREKLTSEKLEDRIKKMTAQFTHQKPEKTKEKNTQ